MRCWVVDILLKCYSRPDLMMSATRSITGLSDVSERMVLLAALQSMNTRVVMSWILTDDINHRRPPSTRRFLLIAKHSSLNRDWFSFRPCHHQAIDYVLHLRKLALQYVASRACTALGNQCQTLVSSAVYQQAYLQTKLDESLECKVPIMSTVSLKAIINQDSLDGCCGCCCCCQCHRQVAGGALDEMETIEQRKRRTEGMKWKARRQRNH